jgi:hypothetical protein
MYLLLFEPIISLFCEHFCQIRSKCLWRWYVNTIIVFLDIIYCPVFYLKCNILETGFYLRLQAKPTQLGSIDRGSPLPPGFFLLFFINWALLSRFCLNMETESSLWNTVSWIKNRMIDNIQKHNNCIFVTAGGSDVPLILLVLWYTSVCV